MLGYAIIKNKSGSTLIIQDGISLNNDSKMKLELDGCSHGFVTIRTYDDIPVATNIVVRKGFNSLPISSSFLLIYFENHIKSK